MRRVMVRYKVKKARRAEHERLLRAVFRELARTAPGGLRYAAYRLEDGVSFVHVAFLEGRRNPLDASEAFAAFTENIGERCQEPPRVTEMKGIGDYGM